MKSMTKEKLILSGSTQYNDFKGQVAADENVSPTKNDSPIYECDDDKTIIGWQIGKHDYNGPIHITILSVDSTKVTNARMDDDAEIYRTPIEISVEDFINSLGRMEITLLRSSNNDHFGKEFTFIHPE